LDQFFDQIYLNSNKTGRSLNNKFFPVSIRPLHGLRHADVMFILRMPN